jgi:hypothetical protein
MDYTNKYVRIGEDTALDCVHIFSKAMIHLFGPVYFGAPNE